MRAAGALHILGRMEDRPGETYAARLAGKATWEDCPNVADTNQYAFVRVDGNEVTISYADPSWNPESLERDGNVMSGSRCERNQEPLGKAVRPRAGVAGCRGHCQSQRQPPYGPRGHPTAAGCAGNRRRRRRADCSAFRGSLRCPVWSTPRKDYAADSGQALSTVLNFLEPVTTMVMRRLHPESFSQEAYDSTVSAVFRRHAGPAGGATVTVAPWATLLQPQYQRCRAVGERCQYHRSRRGRRSYGAKNSCRSGPQPATRGANNPVGAGPSPRPTVPIIL